MRKNFAKKIFALLLTAVMLLTTYLPITAVSVESPSVAAEEEEVYYSIAYDSGVLRVKINPEKVYEILQDRQLTREELLGFIPEDILDLIENKDSLSADDLTTILSNYITVDDLLKMIEEMPSELTTGVIDIELLESIITVNELLAAIPLDTMFAAVEFKYVEALLTDEVLELMLKDEVINDVLDESFITDLINNTTIIDDVFKDPAKKEKLFALLTDSVITSMISDSKVGPLLQNYMFSGDVMSLIANDPVSVDALTKYVMAEERKSLLEGFLSDPAVANALLQSASVKEVVLNAKNLKTLISKGVISKELVSAVFTTEQLKALITSDIINTLVGDATFLNKVFDDTELVNKILTPELIGKLAELDSIIASLDLVKLFDDGYVTIAELETAGAVNTSKVNYSYLTSKGLTTDVLIDDGVINMSAVTADLLYSKNIISVDDLKSYGILNMSSIGSDLIETILTQKVTDGIITISYIRSKNIVEESKLTPEALYDAGIISVADLETYGILDMSSIGSDLIETILTQKITDGDISADYILSKGIIDESKLSPKTLYDKGILTVADLDNYGITLSAVMNGSVDDSIKEQILSDKIESGALGVDTLNSLGALNIPSDFAKTLYNDGKITVGDLEYYGILNLNNVSNDVKERIISDKITLDVLEDLDAINIPADFAETLYKDGKITVDDLKNYGILDMSAVSDALIEKIVSDKINSNVITPEFLEENGIIDSTKFNASYIIGKIGLETLRKDGIVDTSAVVVKKLIANGAVTTDDIKSFLGGDEEIKKILTNNDEAKQVLINYISNSSTITVDDYWKHVDLGLIVNKIDMNKVISFAQNEETYNKMAKEMVERGLVGSAFSALGKDVIQNVVKANISTLLGNSEIANKFLGIYGRDKLVSVLGGYSALIEKFNLRDGAVAAIGGYGALIKFFDPMDIVDAIGVPTVMKYVDLKALIEKLGGFSSLLSYYSNDEISTIVETIGYPNIIKFVQDSGLAEKVDLQAIASDVLDVIKAKDPGLEKLRKEIGKRLYKILMTDISSLTLNGKEIYDAGKFDITAILSAVIGAIPDVEEFISIGVDGTITSLILRAEMTSGSYALGIEFGWMGDPSELNSFIEGYKEYFKFQVSDELDITLSVATPAILADIYETVLTSDKVPAALKEAMLTLPAGDVNGVIEFIESLDEAEIKAIQEAVSSKMGDITAKAYDAIDKLGTISAEAADKLKAGVDSIADGFESAEKLEKLADTLVEKINANIPAELKSLKVSEFYVEDGSFNFKKNFEQDLYERISGFISLPEEIKILFAGNDMTVSGSVDVTVSLGNIYKLHLVTSNDGEMDIFLPAGIALYDTLKNIPAIADDIEFGLYDVALNNVTVMPNEDITLYTTETYTIIFMAGDQVVATIKYPKGATAIEEPALPDATPGFTNSWSDYVLNSAATITVTLVETPNTYKVVYVDENDVSLNADYSFTFGTLTEKAVVDNAPAMKGHSVILGAYDIDAVGDIIVRVTYKPNTYTVTYVDVNGDPLGKTYSYTYGKVTVDDIKANAPTRTGYTLEISGFDPELDTDQYVTVIYGEEFYTITYVDKNGNQIGNTYTYKYGEATDASIRANAPAKKGHSISLSAFDASYEGDQTITVTYTANTYTVTYVDVNGDPLGKTYSYTYGKVTVEDIMANAPTRTGYTLEISGFDPEHDDNQDVTVIYSSRIYSIIYKSTDGSIWGSFAYLYGKDEQFIQSVILRRIEDYTYGYDITFSAFDASLAEDQTIIITLVPKTFTFSYTDADENVISSFEFAFGTLTDSLVRSNIPAKKGHSADISDYDASKAGDISVIVTYVPNKYKVTFMSEDKVTIIDEVVFTYGDKTLSEIPNVPEKLGYTGKWAEFTLDDGDLTVYPEYTAIEYTARFVYEDGTLYKEVTFTIETESIDEPALPAKEGYTGKWEDYTLGASDITIRPVYTPIEADEPDITPDQPSDPSEPATDGDDQQTTSGCDGVNWLVVAAVPVVVIVAGVVLYFIRKKLII